MPTALDLFGDDSSDDDDDDEQQTAPSQAASQDKADEDDDDSGEKDAEFQGKGVVGLSSPTLAGVKLPDGEDDDAMDVDSPEAPEPPKVVHQGTLKIPSAMALSNQVSVHVSKLPNLMGIQMQPFDVDNYFPSKEDEEFGPSAASLVRWRYQNPEEKGDDAPIESNTRLVEWEDGSWTLHLGKEAFEMDFKDSSTKEGFAGFNGYLFQSLQTQTDGQKKDDNKTVLECVAPVTSRVTIHPSSLTSEAHKSLTVAVRQKTLKQARIATLATSEDPEQVKAARIRASADVHKQQRKKGGVGAGSHRRPRMSRGYLEDDYDDDAYDTTNIRGMKRRVREGDDMDDFIDNDEESSEEDTTFHTKRVRRGKEADKPVDDDEEEEELMLDNDGDEEDEVAPQFKHKSKSAHRNVFDEEDDDD